MRNYFTITILVLVAPFALHAENNKTVADSIQKLKHDIYLARIELANKNEKISKERILTVQEIDQLHTKNNQLEIKIKKLDKEEYTIEQQQTIAKNKLLNLKNIIKFLHTLTREYRRSFAAHLTMAQTANFKQQIKSIDQILNNPTAENSLLALPQLLQLSNNYLDQQLAGSIYSGKALTMQGDAQKGTFFQFGPVNYFVANNPKNSGLIISKIGSNTPTIFANFSRQNKEIDTIATLPTGKLTYLPIDSTLGSAIKLQQAKDNFWQHLKKGGIVIIPLLLFAIISLVLAIYKLISLQFLNLNNSESKIKLILQHLHNNQEKQAIEIAQQMHRPLGEVLCAGIKYQNAPKEHIEEIMYERILAQVPALEKFLSPIAVCASTAPLLGLLGTVTGMIHTFKLITIFGTGDASMLSGGISEALITTEVGLIIAVPALLFHAYLSRRVKKAIAMTQQSAIMFLNGLKLSTTEEQ